MPDIYDPRNVFQICRIARRPPLPGDLGNSPPSVRAGRYWTPGDTPIKREYMTGRAKYVKLPGGAPETVSAGLASAILNILRALGVLHHGTVVGWAGSARGRDLYVVHMTAPGGPQLLNLFRLSAPTACQKHGHVPASITRAFVDPVDHYRDLLDQRLIDCVETTKPCESAETCSGGDCCGCCGRCGNTGRGRGS